MSNHTGSNAAMGESVSPLPIDQRQPALPLPSYICNSHNPVGSLFTDLTWVMSADNFAPLLLNMQAALAVGALVLQTQVSVERPNDGKALPVSQLVIGIADSGERKSQVIEDFMSPVTAYLDAQKQKHAKAWQHYDEEMEHWEKARKKLVNTRAGFYAAKLEEESREGNNLDVSTHHKKKNSPDLEQIKQRLANTEQSIERLKQKKPTPPKQASIGTLSDATPQAIPKFIKEQRIRSLGIFTAEGEEILTNGIKHKSSILNKGYSGEASQRYRVGEGNQSYDVPITVCIFVQPDVADKAFGGSNSKMRGTGTLARALIAFPPSTQGYRLLTPPAAHGVSIILSGPFTPVQTSQPLPNIKETKERYKRWVSDQMHRADQHSGDERIKLTLSREAQALWYQAFNECEINLRQGGRYERFRDHASKLPDQWLRVATIIHCYNNGLSGEVSVVTLRTALSLVNAFSTHFTQLFPSVSKEEKAYLSMRNYLNDKRQACRYLPKSIVTSNGPLRPVSKANIALDKMYEQGEINLIPYQNFNNQGRQTKSIMVIDLFPQYQPDQWQLYESVQKAYRLNQLQ